MNSTQIIEQAKQRFGDLEHKGFDWSSFYNGFIEGSVHAITESEEQNQRMREWFKERTGIEDATLKEHMDNIDKNMREALKYESRPQTCNAPNATYCEYNMGRVVGCGECKYYK